MSYHVLTSPTETANNCQPCKVGSWAKAYDLVTEWIGERTGVTASERAYFTQGRRPSPPLPGSKVRVVDGATGESIHVIRVAR